MEAECSSEELAYTWMLYLSSVFVIKCITEERNDVYNIK